MKYKYKNLKHVLLHSIEPFGEKVFDNKLEGGGVELIEEIKEKKDKKKILEDD
jgi:hypothetical protein